MFNLTAHSSASSNSPYARPLSTVTDPSTNAKRLPVFMIRSFGVVSIPMLLYGCEVNCDSNRAAAEFFSEYVDTDGHHLEDDARKRAALSEMLTKLIDKNGINASLNFFQDKLKLKCSVKQDGTNVCISTYTTGLYSYGQCYPGVRPKIVTIELQKLSPEDQKSMKVNASVSVRQKLIRRDDGTWVIQ